MSPQPVYVEFGAEVVELITVGPQGPRGAAGASTVEAEAAAAAALASQVEAAASAAAAIGLALEAADSAGAASVAADAAAASELAASVAADAAAASELAAAGSAAGAAASQGAARGSELAASAAADAAVDLVAILEDAGGGQAGAFQQIGESDPNTAFRFVVKDPDGNDVSVARITDAGVVESRGINAPYTTGFADNILSAAVGGAPSLPALTWKTRSITEVLDAILFPTVLPTYTIPTLSSVATITGIREIGQAISQQLTGVGSKNDAGAFSEIRFRRGGSVISTDNAPTVGSISAIPNQFGFANPNNPNFSYTSVYTDSFTVVDGDTSWDIQATYGAGQGKPNSLNVADTRPAAVRSVNAPQAASSTLSSPVRTVTGIYPYFWGLSGSAITAADVATAIAAGTENKVLAASTGTVAVTFDASSQFLWVAIPSASAVKTSWFNTSLNNGSIGAGQFILAPVTQAVNAPNGFWSAVPFRVYISGFATTTSGVIELRN